jgi:hypothetical protein
MRASAHSTISALRLYPADLPNLSQSGLNRLIGMLFSSAHRSPNESTPRAVPEITSVY